MGGLPAIWPDILGVPPDDSALAAWETEYDASVSLEAQEKSARAALQEKLFQDALNDPNAPQAVKDYKAAKDKP